MMNFAFMTKVSTKHFVILIITHFLAFCGVASAADNIDAAMQELASDIISNVENKKGSDIIVAITPFQHSYNTCSEFSYHVSDSLMVEMLRNNKSNIKIVDRTQLNSFAEESNLGGSGWLDPSTAVKLGEWKGIDALVIGSMSNIGPVMKLTAKMIDTESGFVTSIATNSFPIRADFKRLLDSDGFYSCSHIGEGSRVKTSSSKSRNSSNKEAKCKVDDINLTSFDLGRIANDFGSQMVVSSSNDKRFIKPNSNGATLTYSGFEVPECLLFEAEIDFKLPPVPNERDVYFILEDSSRKKLETRVRLWNWHDRKGSKIIGPSSSQSLYDGMFKWKTQELNLFRFEVEDGNFYLSVNGQTAVARSIDSLSPPLSIKIKGLYPADVLLNFVVGSEQ